MADAQMPHEGHQKHLCYLNNIGYQISNSQDYKEMVNEPKFLCKICGRVANSKENLCKPEKL